MKKHCLIYVFIVAFWIIASVFLIWQTVYISLPIFKSSNLLLWKKIIGGIALYGNCRCFLYFWLNSIKDLMFTIFFIFLRRKINKQYSQFDGICKGKSKKVILLYCTCNDLNPEALLTSSNQDYPNVKIVILDDSTKDKYIKEIDTLAKENDFEVVRRIKHTGFKAGNLNNYLKSVNPDNYDYIAVLDSDERVPRDFVSKLLNYFEKDKQIGAVQATHIASKGTNIFQNMLGMCVKSNGKICQIMKNFYGSSSLFGHGLMISKECLRKAGGFPEVVAEDIAISVKIRDAGFKIIFAPNVVCQEEFPTNYLSLKKRQCKWTQGNVEYRKKYNKEINRSKISWYEKLDLKLSHYSLPIIPILSLLLVINSLLLGFLDCVSRYYGVWFFVLLIIFLLSPLIPDLFTYGASKKSWLILPYFVLNRITYASMEPRMVSTVILELLGKKAKFIITPKENTKMGFLDVLKASWSPVIFSIAISVLTYFSFHNIGPTRFLTICCIMCPFVVLLSNFPVNRKKREK